MREEAYTTKLHSNTKLFCLSFGFWEVFWLFVVGCFCCCCCVHLGLFCFDFKNLEKQASGSGAHCFENTSLESQSE